MTKTKAKAKPGPSEQTVLAAKAQAKAQPANRINAANIMACQEKLGGKPSEVLGISPNALAQLATGKKEKAALPEAQQTALRDFGAALGSRTFYGRKLAGMLWAIETGARRNGGGR